MFKKLFTSLIAISLFTFVNAQNDKQAQEILNGVSAKYKTFNTIKTSFSYIIENPNSKATEKQGGLLYLKGEKYKLEFAGQEIISDGKTVWTFLRESNEVQVNDPNANKDAIAPNNIFTMYEKGFYYKFVKEVTEEGKVLQLIDLTPIDKAKHYFKITLSISKAEKMVVRTKIFDKNGTKSTYNIDKFNPNFPLSEELFSFNKSQHAGVEVVDLR